MLNFTRKMISHESHIILSSEIQFNVEFTSQASLFTFFASLAYVPLFFTRATKPLVLNIERTSQT